MNTTYQKLKKEIETKPLVLKKTKWQYRKGQKNIIMRIINGILVQSEEDKRPKLSIIYIAINVPFNIEAQGTI